MASTVRPTDRAGSGSGTSRPSRNGTMKVRCDPEVDTAYLTIVDQINAGEPVRQVMPTPDAPIQGEFVLNLDREGQLLGVEGSCASHRLRPQTLALAKSGWPQNAAGYAGHETHWCRSGAAP